MREAGKTKKVIEYVKEHDNIAIVVRHKETYDKLIEEKVLPKEKVILLEDEEKFKVKVCDVLE